MDKLPSWRLQLTVRHLRRGGLIAYPTEGVYGLGCDPWNEQAVSKILALKGRSSAKGMILIAADLEQLLPFIHPSNPDMLARILPTWPGAVTWLLPASPLTPFWLTGKHSTIACRVTDHPIAAQLCRAFGGPLVSTSANPAGKPAARALLQVRRYFRRQVAELYLLPGALGRLTGPTPIYDARSGRCLRTGGNQVGGRTT